MLRIYQIKAEVTVPETVRENRLYSLQLVTRDGTRPEALRGTICAEYVPKIRVVPDQLIFAPRDSIEVDRRRVVWAHDALCEFGQASVLAVCL